MSKVFNKESFPNFKTYEMSEMDPRHREDIVQLSKEISTAIYNAMTPYVDRKVEEGQATNDTLSVVNMSLIMGYYQEMAQIHRIWKGWMPGFLELKEFAEGNHAILLENLKRFQKCDHKHKCGEPK